MAIPNTMKVPVPWEYIAPSGALFLGVEAATDFDKRGQGDDQLRDKETGERVWLVKALDLDPEAGKFGATKEIKVKVVAPVQPVPPTATVPGYPPMVEFTGVTLTPYVDSQKCKDATAKCRARLAWSIRATGMTEPQAASKPAKAA
ncbi:hypothetical protein [Couchioplanes azureus]|uniref:hypothetical protein n=1 Tax=Couchioplanes caeruleus TaxID=56438 RepID=UPI0016707164|nr:hypothetical protein [Couchioplanes caeruleus]GGQ78463.1 hypothetical protein GCM10010166_55810 [Couchioplanes caeruleus subsp. azureus]